MSLRDKLVEEIVEQELFHTYTETEDGVLSTYVAEGFDEEMMKAEGSGHFSYVHVAMGKYYQKYKSRINELVDEMLKEALDHQPTD